MIALLTQSFCFREDLSMDDEDDDGDDEKKDDAEFLRFSIDTPITRQSGARHRASVPNRLVYSVHDVNMCVCLFVCVISVK